MNHSWKLLIAKFFDMAKTPRQVMEAQSPIRTKDSKRM